MFKNRRKNHAVSEVFGTILLLLISVTLFSVVYVALFSVQVERSSPSVNIVGTIEGNNLILENRGGESLSLGSEIILGSGGESAERISIDDYLSAEYKNNGKWDIGERIVYPLTNLTNFDRFDPLDVSVVDFDTNSIVMMGTVQEARVADVKVEMSVSDETPDVGQNIKLTITVRNQNGPSDAAGIIIKNILPGSLTYVSNVTSNGTYDSSLNVWDVGNITVGSFVTLEITARVESYGYNSQLTQLAVLLDGSTSISPSNWSLMKQGLHDAISNPNVFPNDGSVELTVIQFAGVCANVVLNPVVVNYDNYQSIADSINKTSQIGGYTPMAAGISLAAKKLLSSNNFGGFNPSHRQIINLVTDGNPNVSSLPGVDCGNKDTETKGKAAAENARYYLLNALSMTEEQDEFDVAAVRGTQGINITWLNKSIVWPQPGTEKWPPEKPGWVHEVLTWEDFYNSINQQFSILFKRIDCSAELLSSNYMDPNTKNNGATISIYPNPQ